MKKEIIIVSGFSGVGKSTLLKRVLHKNASFELIRSCTTRKKRDETDYYAYMSVSEFEELKEAGGFLESSCYSDKLYGTPVSEIERILASGKIPVAEIDTNRFMSVVENGYFTREQIHGVFIADDADSLLSKLIERQTESWDEIIHRLGISIEESKYVNYYDCIIINKNIEKATSDLVSFMSSYKAVSPIFNDKEFRIRLSTLQRSMRELDWWTYLNVLPLPETVKSLLLAEGISTAGMLAEQTDDELCSIVGEEHSTNLLREKRYIEEYIAQNRINEIANLVWPEELWDAPFAKSDDLLVLPLQIEITKVLCTAGMNTVEDFLVSKVEDLVVAFRTAPDKLKQVISVQNALKRVFIG